MSGSFALFLAALALSSCWCCWALGRMQGWDEILNKLSDEERDRLLGREERED
jgi:hypothetical protein